MIERPTIRNQRVSVAIKGSLTRVATVRQTHGASPDVVAEVPAESAKVASEGLPAEVGAEPPEVEAPGPAAVFFNPAAASDEPELFEADPPLRLGAVRVRKTSGGRLSGQTPPQARDVPGIVAAGGDRQSRTRDRVALLIGDPQRNARSLSLVDRLPADLARLVLHVAKRVRDRSGVSRRTRDDRARRRGARVRKGGGLALVNRGRCRDLEVLSGDGGDEAGKSKQERATHAFCRDVGGAERC